MNCSELSGRGLVNDYALGEAIPDEAKDHLKGCELCSGRLERLRSTLLFIDEQLREAGSVVVPEGLVGRISEKAQARERVWRRRLVWGSVAAVVWIALSLGVFPGQTPDSPKERVSVAGASALQTPLPNPVSGDKPEAFSEEDPKPVQALAHATPDSQMDSSPEEIEPARVGTERRSSAAPLSAGLVPPVQPPEVLVPPGQEGALLRFYENWQKGRISFPPEASLQLPAPIKELSIRRLSVRPIVLEPITFAEISKKWSGE